MRQLQNLLFVIGATSTGLVVSAGIAFTIALGILPSGRDAGGAVVAFMVLAACGSVMGAVIGFAGAIRWISQRSKKPWPLSVWIGILVGVATGIAIGKSTLLDSSIVGDLIKWLPVTIVCLATMAFVGGSLGKLIATCRTHKSLPFWDRFNKPSG